MRCVRVWTERGHGVAMETASVGAYAIGVTWTQKPTPVLPSLWRASVLGWYGTPGGCAGMQQRSLTDLTHKTTHIVPRGSDSSIWSRMASRPYLLSRFFSISPFKHKRWGFSIGGHWKDDQAEHEVIRTKQKHRLGTRRQLKPTSYKSEGTWYRHSIFFGVDKEARVKKKIDRNEKIIKLWPRGEKRAIFVMHHDNLEVAAQKSESCVQRGFVFLFALFVFVYYLLLVLNWFFNLYIQASKWTPTLQPLFLSPFCPSHLSCADSPLRRSSFWPWCWIAEATLFLKRCQRDSTGRTKVGRN